jgi:uncharacterized damage-inducible protein DinB
MKYRGIAPLVVLMFLATAAFAQSDAQKSAGKPKNQDSPLSAANKFGYGYLKNVLLATAQKMPEEYYSFKPVWVVRNFGQVLRHVAESQYYFCATVMGEKDPDPRIERTKTSKADLIAALKDSFAYCDKAYDGMTDASATQMVKFHGFDLPKLFVLSANNMHTTEHYGNLVIYMRLKNVLPPSSEPGFMQ